MLPLAVGGIVFGFRKRRHDLVALERRVPAAVIEVQVGVDHDVNVFRRNAGGGQIVQQLCRLAENLNQSFRQLVADPGFDQDRLLASADHDGIQSHRNVVVLVGLYFLAPHDLGDDAEECSAVEPINAVGDGHEFEVAKRQAVHEGALCLHNLFCTALFWNTRLGDH